MVMMMKKLLFTSFLLCISLLAAEPSYAVPLYFPHVDTTYGWETEIAIINTSPNQSVTGTLRALSNTGQLVETKSVTISAHGRKQITVANEFTNHTQIGYIVYDADSDTIQGYIKFYKQGKYRVAIPAVKNVNTSKIYITHIDSGIQWWTGVSLVNTTSETKNITITFNTGEIRTITLNANEHKPFLISSLFNNQTTPSIQSAVITNASGIIGLEVFGTYDDKQLEGILLTDKTASTLYYPYVAGGDWWTGIVAYNPSESSCTVTITPYNSQGTVLSSSSLSIPGKSKYVGFITALGIPANTAWFKIDSTSPLSGFELIGTNDYEQLAAYAGNGGTGAKAGILPKIEKSGWTSIAFVNTEASAASVTLTGYNDNGTAVGTQVIPIDGHAKYVGDVVSVNATYIAYSSDRNVVGAQLNGTADWTMLDGLPGLADPVGTSATGNVTSTTSGIIQTPSGASINVPVGAVPRDITGAAGTVAFSIEPALNATSNPPSGFNRSSDIYQFGPEGMTFATPVQITLPVTGNIDRDTASLFRINPSTGANERYPSTYDPMANTVTTQTFRFSPWYIGSSIGGGRDGKADGCFKVDNTITHQWRRVCVTNYTLKYPDQSSMLPPMSLPNGELSSLWSDSGCYSGWCNQGNWYLLQGTYNFCVDAKGTSGSYSHGFIPSASINSPWYYDVPVCTDLNIAIPLPNSGPCDCIPTATPTFGTGGLQVTLTWHSTPSVDLDLWIIEPDGSKTFYGRTPSPTGGTLDRDNKCGNYEDGKPENIFYTTPSAGQYTIQINWFGTCSGNIDSVPYAVRIVNKGNAKTYSGSITGGRGALVTVDTITVN